MGWELPDERKRQARGRRVHAGDGGAFKDVAAGFNLTNVAAGLYPVVVPSASPPPPAIAAFTAATYTMPANTT